MMRPLVVAVLAQAVADLDSPNLRARADAERWFMCRSPGRLSFDTVCDALGLDSDAVRDRLRARGLLPETHEDAACARWDGYGLVPVEHCPCAAHAILVRETSAPGGRQRLDGRERGRDRGHNVRHAPWRFCFEKFD